MEGDVTSLFSPPRPNKRGAWRSSGSWTARVRICNCAAVREVCGEASGKRAANRVTRVCPRLASGLHDGLR